MMLVQLLRAEEPGGDGTLFLPAFTVLLEGEMVLIRDPHCDVSSRPVGVHSTPFVEERIDRPPVRNDNDGTGADLE